LLGYKAEPWTALDSVLMTRVIGYVGLAQTQGEIERFVVEMVQAGIGREKLEALFPGLMGNLDEALLGKVQLFERLVPEGVLWKRVIPSMTASNNWVVAPQRSATGNSLLANDPHLETNRLPNVWSEAAMSVGDRYAVGAGMPGIPGIIIGRTNDVSWGATYTFLDGIDFWVEQCRAGQYLKDGEWHDFRKRTETIKRKKGSPVDVTFYENDHGVLEGNPNTEGHYLATRWASADSGARSLNAFQGMWEAKSVEEGMTCLGDVETAWNWVLADRQGNIGYQMSGLMPKRPEGVNGFTPVPGWDSANDWQGFHHHTDLPRCVNPENGYFVTANHDLNAWGNESPINIAMSGHRFRRISTLLEAKEKLTLEDFQKIQYDDYSLEAERFMSFIADDLPDTPAGNALREWDYRYAPESEATVIFEAFYRELYNEVFGKAGFGADVMEFVWKETGLVVGFFDNFENILLAEDSPWFEGRTRDEIYKAALERALDTEVAPWRASNHMIMKHLLFGGRLPRFLGFDQGPVALRGGRATPHQGQIFRAFNRDLSFTPSFRFVTDLETDVIHSNLAGGPSDRRFSKWYVSDLDNWLSGKYKEVRPK
jgi:penicillin amidase